MSRLTAESLLRGLSLAAAVFTMAGSPAAEAQAPAAEPGSSFHDWGKLRVTPTPLGAVRAVVDSPIPQFERLEIHATTLHPGYASHPPHHHPQEELILIKEGTVETSVNGRTDRIGPGSLVFLASHDVHNLTNVGTTPATYYVINFYTAATAGVRDRPAAEWAPADRLRSSAIDWEKLQPIPTPTGVRRSLISSPTLTFANLEVHATTVRPGASASKPHRHPWPLLVIIKEGMVEATVDGVSHTAGAGSIIYAAPGAVLGLRNPGAVPSTYFVFSVSSAATPRPEG